MNLCECGHRSHDTWGCLTPECGCDTHWDRVLVTAAVRAERERLLARLETLHKPLRVYGECDHEHTDEDVWAGRAFDVWEIGYTCEFQYEVCMECCRRRVIGPLHPDDPELRDV